MSDGAHNGAVPGLARRVLLVGGSSEIGLAIVTRLADAAPLEVTLLGRDPAALDAAGASLRSGGVAGVATTVVDADDFTAHESAVDAAFARAGGFDIVIVAIGRLGAQAGLDADPAEMLEVMRVSFLGAGSLLWHSLRRLRDQGRGTMIVLSSVAAERPRAANAIYCAAKAGLDALAHGLADTVAGTGVRVLVVRPGFVTTKMTAGLPKAPLSTTADAVAAATVAALPGRAHTIWVPGTLRWVLAILRHLPRPIFRRLPG